jgi:hypothetical protein
MSDNNKVDGKYKVGYGKPPKSGQFKKGQSGNKPGKRKGTKNFKTDFLEELQTEIEVTEGSRKIKISKQRAMIKRLINGSLNGDSKNTAIAIQLMLDFNNSDEVKDNSKPLTASEIALLSSHLKTREEQEDDL